jgi:hypothetical protein
VLERDRSYAAVAGVADGQPDSPVTEPGDQIQPAAEGLYVAGDDLEAGDLAVLDLGYPGDRHARDGSDLLVARAQLLAVSASWCPRVWGEPPTRLGGVCSCVQGRP